MTVTQPSQRLTAAEYLAFERASPERHEYVDGQVYAMAGASEAHNVIAGNLFAALHAQLRGRPCRVYMADMRVKVSPTGRYSYPDVAALRGEPAFEDADLDTLLNPSTIVEVLSRSTERSDRGDKFADYGGWSRSASTR
jgi:Uma2 family endonuclease